MGLDYILGHLGVAIPVGVVLLLSLVQIAPIKLNPWSRIAKGIGKALNGEVVSKVDNLTNIINEHQVADDEKWASLRRSHILTFGDELRHGKNASEERFTQALRDINEYELYCAEHPAYLNNVASVTIDYIKEEYKRHLEHNDFL